MWHTEVLHKHSVLPVCGTQITIRFSLNMYSAVAAYLRTPWSNPSWEADRFSASQEISGISWNPSVHYRFYRCPPPIPTLNQINPVHAHPTHLTPSKYYPFIYAWASKWSLSLRFPHRKPCVGLSSPPYVLRVTPSSFFSMWLLE